jgi:[protein-PII] uridylyltransferase
LDNLMRDNAGGSARLADEAPYEAEWRRIEQEFQASGDARRAQAALTARADTIVKAAYGASIAPVLRQGVIFVAVGAWGRGTLFPYSPVDLVVMVEGEAARPLLRAPLDECLRTLWDARLRLSHTVKTVGECLEFHEQDPEAAVSLLEARFVAGDEAAYGRFTGKWSAFVERHGGKLSQQIARAAKARHAKYENTVLVSEPDVLETPGGLRDAYLARRLDKLTGRRSGAAGLEEAVSFLSAVRYSLHYRAGADKNAVSSEAQAELAAGVLGGGAATGVEWMRKYFRQARLVHEEARCALERVERAEAPVVGSLRELRSRLSNSEFSVARDRVQLRHAGQPVEDPPVVFRLLEFIARNGVAASPETEASLRSAAEPFAAYCAGTKQLWPMVESVLQLPHARLALRALHNSGLMAGVIPEWKRIEGLVAPESGHRYAMDEHTLQAVERVLALRAEADGGKQRFAQLLEEVDAPAALLYALLIHEAGTAGEAIARVGAEEERSTVAFLVENRNLLAEAMGGRDLDDPATAVQIAAKVGTIEHLRQLTLLTYGCVAAVSREAMTAWRMEQLWRTYEVTHRELTRELETDRIASLPGNGPAEAAFLTGFPTRYLRAHTPGEIEAHLRLYEESRPTGAAVELERIDGGYKLTIIARDKPALFASFAGALSSFGFDILKAEAFSNAKRVILDTFIFADPQRTLDVNPPESERLLDLIRRVAMGKTDGQRLLRGRGAPEGKKRLVQPQVRFDSDACETATLVEIVAEDRPGLLFNLAMVFTLSACNIDVVLIDTKGRKAIDVFYVSHGGQKLAPALQATLKERLLEVC